MNKELWFSKMILPSDNRNVLVKAIGYPDIMVANYMDGVWFSDSIEVGGTKIEVEAWKEIPKYEGCPLTFRTADEARYLSLQTLQLVNNGEYDEDFFEVRSMIISAVSTPNVWFVNIGYRPIKIINALIEAGFHCEQTEDGIEVSWE